MKNLRVEDFYAFRVGAMWRYFVRQHFSFWMICLYLFFEYFRPQAIYPAINVIPWAQTFLIIAFVGALFDRSVKWVSSPVNIWLCLFAIVIFLASHNAYFPEVSQEYYIDFYSWFVIYFLIINIVNTKERFYIFFMVLLFCSAKIAMGTALGWAARGFAFADWGLMGPRGYFQNSGELAILMLTLFPIAFFMYQTIRKKSQVRWWEKLVLLAFWVAPIVTILGSSSRGGQIALVAVLALMFRKSIFRFKPLVGIAVLVLAMAFLLPEEQKERFTEVGEDRTSQQRIYYLENGWEMMKDFPVLGVGYFNFSEYFNMYYQEDILLDNGRAELPHNIFIQVGTDAGFLGLAVFIALILVGLKVAFKPGGGGEADEVFSAISAGLGYGIIGFVVSGQFVTVAYYPFLWIGLAFIVSLNNVLQQTATHRSKLPARKREAVVGLAAR